MEGDYIDPCISKFSYCLADQKLPFNNNSTEYMSGYLFAKFSAIAG